MNEEETEVQPCMARQRVHRHLDFDNTLWRNGKRRRAIRGETIRRRCIILDQGTGRPLRMRPCQL